MELFLARLVGQLALPLLAALTAQRILDACGLAPLFALPAAALCAWAAYGRERAALDRLLASPQAAVLGLGPYLARRSLRTGLPAGLTTLLLALAPGPFADETLGPWRVLVALALFDQAVAWLGRRAPQPPVRGRRLLTLEQAQAEAARRPDAGVGPGLPFGGVLLPPAAGPLHFAVLGASGSGKTLSMRLLLQRACRDIVPESDCRALVFDAKQDTLSLLAGLGLPCPVRTLSIFDERGWAWDIARDVTDPVAAEAVAEVLVPARPQASQPFFDEAARALVYEALCALIAACPGAWTLADVVHACQSRDRLRRLLARTPEGRDANDQYLAKDGTALDILSTLVNRTRAYRTVAAAWRHARQKLSLRDWVEGEFVLVLGNSHTARPAVRAVNQVLFRRLTQLLLERRASATRRTWIFLDELRQAGRLDTLGELAVEGRSRGVCLVLGAQDVEGLEAVYGEKEAHELLGQCAHTAVLRLRSPTSARWAAQLFGEYEAAEQSRTYGPGGASRHVQTGRREALLPSQLMSLLVLPRWQAADLRRLGLDDDAAAPAVDNVVPLTRGLRARDLRRLKA